VTLLALAAHAVATAQGSALTLGQVSVEDQAWLKEAGVFQPIEPELGPLSRIINPRTGLDLTREEVERLRAGRTTAPTAPAQTALRPSQAPESRPAFQALKNSLGGAQPFGPLPAGDYAGSLRGPSLSAEGVSVLKPRAKNLDVRLSASNYLNWENAGAAGAIVQKFETHTADVKVRYGLDTLRPTEVGIEARVHEQDQGFLNGFISGFEHFAARVTNSPNAINLDRSGPGALKGETDQVRLGSRVENEPASIGARLGDVTLSVKTALLDPDAGSFVPKLAARLALTLGTGGRFTEGSSLGAGLSIQQKITDRLYAHGDVRMIVPLDSVDPRGLPLRRQALGGTVGVEYLVNDKTSVGAQLDAQASPNKRTGVHAIDDTYADVTFGVSRMAKILTHDVIVRVYGKEDFNPNHSPRGRIAPHGDSDFQVGVSVSIPLK
jgi:hypothetical protein